MKNTSELYFNGYESTSCMPSSASVCSKSRKYHSWVTWIHQRESRWTPARWKRYWIISHQRLCSRYKVSLAWLAIIDGSFQTSPRSWSQLLNCWRREKVCLEWCLWWSFQKSEETVDYIVCVSSAWHRQAIRCLLWCFWYSFRGCLNTTKAPWRTLPYSWCWVSGSSDGIMDVTSLSN
jgi:hypothetical protein